ncbi:ribosomal biogenesis GTPase RbgA [Mycoplasma haemofelis str. Langford 1]|uniref:Ribosome biogenesis GTPase A n=1 Tax=Mycoplasma haemofelis (strain Langford 1) TaxID=941640 RepID=E8ZK35_MYCHL|nr:GTPase [Mycoplasma haemofelis]CBY93506.1 ribosomal biogenesis GTPase RbgA [Mycoplasma haemofelis str. Langford 1]
MKIKLELPSHVKHAISNLNRFKKEVDLVINVVDARASKTSNLNLYISRIFSKSKILDIFSKSDLASSEGLENSFNFKIQSNRNRILHLIKKALQEERNRLQESGYLNPHFKILVVGMPNTGKSTLINLLKNKKISKAANTPGITRKITQYYLGDNLWLFDSPGIFFYQDISPELLWKLIVINAVPSNFKEYSEILEITFWYLKDKYPNSMDELSADSYLSFIELLAKRYNFKNRGGTFDLERAEEKFLFLLRNGGIRDVSWD